MIEAVMALALHRGILGPSEDMLQKIAALVDETLREEPGGFVSSEKETAA